MSQDSHHRNKLSVNLHNLQGAFANCTDLQVVGIQSAARIDKEAFINDAAIRDDMDIRNCQIVGEASILLHVGRLSSSKSGIFPSPENTISPISSLYFHQQSVMIWIYVTAR